MNRLTPDFRTIADFRKDNCYNAEALEIKLARIEEHIAEYLKQMDKTDDAEPDVQSLTP